MTKDAADRTKPGQSTPPRAETPRNEPSSAGPMRADGGEYVLYCDGASRGNPGRAAAGFALFAPDGTEVAAHGEFLGERLTNNVAEYEALLRGVDNAHALGVRRLRVRMDSELVVRQVLGAYKVKHPGLKPLHAMVLERVRRFDSFQIEHVRRRDNQRADALANAALDDLVSP